MMSSSTVKYLSKFRWLLLLSFSSVFLMFLFQELNLISNTPSIFERLLRRQASAPTTNTRNDEQGLPVRIGALKSLIDLITGLPSSLSETRPNWNYCSKRRRSLDDRKHQNVIKRKLKISITRPTDTFSLDLETSILPNKKKKEKSKTKSEVGKVTDAESATRPDTGGNQSTSGATYDKTDKSRADSVVKVPVKTSYVNQSSLEQDFSSAVDKNSKTASAASTSTVTSNSTATEKSINVLEDVGKMKAINATKINQKNLIQSKKLEEEVGGMIDVSSIKAIDFTPKNNVNIKATNTTIAINDEFQGTKSLETDFFFMYDLDEEFWWRWPKPETDCSQNGYLTHAHSNLSGLGTPILPDEGLFLTWHFSLFSSLFNRMKRSRRRTFDPEKASLFIIPYDLGLDGYLDATSCKNTRKCTKGYPEKVQEHVMKYPYFTRNEGRDHAVLWSLGQYHPWPHNNCDTFMKNFCEKCTFTCYWMDPTKENNRFISIPFPSGYHWWDGIKDIPWELGSDSSPNSSRRNLTAVYLGSTHTLNPAHTKIRRAMTSQCNASSECHWKQIAHSSTDSNIAELLSIYRRSVFCLCPPGDDPARKAVFDSILSGCIPVIFEVATLYNQYPWHLGEEASLDISVNIPGGLVRSGKLDFMTVLSGISAETIKLKQIAIAKYAPQIQYSAPPLDFLKNKSDVTPWDPPFKDGVDLTLDGMFNRVSRNVRNLSNDIPKRLMTSRQWSKEYDVVKIKIPGIPLTGLEVTPGQPGQTHGVKGHNKNAHQSNHNKAHNGV